MTTILVYPQDTDDDTGYENGKGTWVANPINNGTGGRFGCRFINVTVPNGSTITSATLTTIDNGSSSGVNGGRIYGAAEDNAAPFDNSNKPSTKTLTSAFVQITDASVNVYDVTAIVAEIIARGGWVSGNNLALIGATTGAGGSLAWQKDADNGLTPKLEIIYTAGGGSGGNSKLMLMGVN